MNLRRVSLWLMGGSLSMIGVISIASFACKKKDEPVKPRTPPVAQQAPSPALDVIRRFHIGDMVRVKLDGRIGQVTNVEDDRQASVHRSIPDNKITRWSQYTLSVAVPAEKGHYATIRMYDFQLEPAGQQKEGVR